MSIPSPVLVMIAAGMIGLSVLLWPLRQTPLRWTPQIPERPGTGRRWLARIAGSDLDARSGSGRQHLVPEALELLALCLVAGGSAAGSARSVAMALPADLGKELAAVGEAMARGESPRAAWDAAGAWWTPARHSLELAESAGIPPGVALRQAAQDLRRDAIGEVEVGAARLGVRLVIPLGLAFLPAFVLTTIIPMVLALVEEVTW